MMFLTEDFRLKTGLAEMLKGGPNLDGWDRIRLEVFDATDSYDEAKAAKVFAHLAKLEPGWFPLLPRCGRMPRDLKLG